MPLLRRLLRRFSSHDPAPRIPEGRYSLPRKSVPQLRRLPALLPVRTAQPFWRQCSPSDGSGTPDDLRRIRVASAARGSLSAQRTHARVGAGRRAHGVPGDRPADSRNALETNCTGGRQLLCHLPAQLDGVIVCPGLLVCLSCIGHRCRPFLDRPGHRSPEGRVPARNHSRSHSRGQPECTQT